LDSRSWISQVKQLGFWSLVGATCLFAAEVSSRIDQRLRWFDVLSARIEPLGEDGYRPKRGGVFRYPNGTAATINTMGFRGPVVTDAKPSDTFRAILLGGSTTHGWGVNDDQTIDAYLRLLLSQRHPGHRFEVINLAFDAYDSYQDYERLRRDGVRLDPDLIIVNSGINDVRNAQFPSLRDRDPRTFLYTDVLEAEREIQRDGEPSAWTKVKHFSYLARLPGVLRGQMTTRRERAVRYRQPPHPEAIAYFARNLRRIASLVGDRPVALVFSTPPSALASSFAPGDTSPATFWIVNAATTQRYRDLLADRMQQVAGELQRLGHHVTYLRPMLPPAAFLDDCHLSPDGNRALAAAFVAASDPYVRAWEARSDEQRLSQNGPR
jgi:lysophospholipase L1-like esterase